MATADLLDRCAFPEGELHLGVSGGADSVAMAVLARATGRPFTIWHVNHGVRPAADADAAFVETLATEWGVPFELRCLDLDEDLAVAIKNAIGIDPEICRARALEHTWENSARQFEANLVSTRRPGEPAVPDAGD